MKTASLSQLKKELTGRSSEELIGLCLRLARHKKESKELLNYLVFESSDETSYRQAVKDEIEGEFDSMNKANLYWAKKTIRKSLRNLNKYIRFSSEKATEVELRIFFCQQIKDSGLPIRNSQALINLYERQVLSAEKAYSALHPDLQFDYEEALLNLKRE